MSGPPSISTISEGGSRQSEYDEKISAPHRIEHRRDGSTGTHNLPPAAGDAPDLLPPLHFSYHKQYIVFYIIFLLVCNLLIPIILFYPLFFRE